MNAGVFQEVQKLLHVLRLQKDGEPINVQLLSGRKIVL
jgi:hypothetical protein